MWQGFNQKVHMIFQSVCFKQLASKIITHPIEVVIELKLNTFFCIYYKDQM